MKIKTSMDSVKAMLERSQSLGRPLTNENFTKVDSYQGRKVKLAK